MRLVSLIRNIKKAVVVAKVLHDELQPVLQAIAQHQENRRIIQNKENAQRAKLQYTDCNGTVLYYNEQTNQWE